MREFWFERLRLSCSFHILLRCVIFRILIRCVVFVIVPIVRCAVFVIFFGFTKVFTCSFKSKKKKKSLTYVLWVPVVSNIWSDDTWIIVAARARWMRTLRRAPIALSLSTTTTRHFSSVSKGGILISWSNLGRTNFSLTRVRAIYPYAERHPPIIDEYYKVAVTQGIIPQELLPAICKTHSTRCRSTHFDTPWTIQGIGQLQKCPLGQVFLYMFQEVSGDMLQKIDTQNVFTN